MWLLLCLCRVLSSPSGTKTERRHDNWLALSQGRREEEKVREEGREKGKKGGMVGISSGQMSSSTGRVPTWKLEHEQGLPVSV